MMVIRINVHWILRARERERIRRIIYNRHSIRWKAHFFLHQYTRKILQFKIFVFFDFFPLLLLLFVFFSDGMLMILYPFPPLLKLCSDFLSLSHSIFKLFIYIDIDMMRIVCENMKSRPIENFSIIIFFFDWYKLCVLLCGLLQL